MTYMSFTPSQCQELKPYYFQWMNRLQRQAVEWRISSEKESDRKTERTHENKSSQGETDYLNAYYVAHYTPWINAPHHVMQRFIILYVFLYDIFPGIWEKMYKKYIK